MNFLGTVVQLSRVPVTMMWKKIRYNFTFDRCPLGVLGTYACRHIQILDFDIKNSGKIEENLIFIKKKLPGMIAGFRFSSNFFIILKKILHGVIGLEFFFLW